MAGCVFMGGCLQDGQPNDQDDLALAEKALLQRDIGDAEMYFERYLRKNPQGEQRWMVWQQLLSIAMDIRYDRPTAREYLEIMLAEFEDQPDRRRIILLRLAEICEEMRAYDRALILWENLAKDPESPDYVKARIYIELARGYLRRLEFTRATDTLGMCLELKVNTSTQADCLYALAETQVYTEDLDAAGRSLQNLLELSGVPEDRRVLAIFMLGDVLDQQGKTAEALARFESIRGNYPNEKVISLRITNVRKRMK